MMEVGKEKVFSVTEIAELMQVDRRTILRAIREGRLKGTQIGHGYVVAESELLKFVKGGSTMRRRKKGGSAKK